MKKQDIIPGKRIIFSGILIFSEIIFIYLLLDTLCEISYIIEIFMKLTSLAVAVVLLIILPWSEPNVVWSTTRFIGFPERAEAVYNFIFTNSGKKGIVLSKQGIPIKDNKYVITEKTFSVKELLKKR